MRTLYHHIKKQLCIAGVALVSSISVCNTALADTPPPSPADVANNYLKQIEDHTNNILQRVNDIPAFIGTTSKLALSWLSSDTSQSTSDMQGNFTTIGNALNQDITDKVALQSKLNTDLFTNTTNYPFINDIAYSILLGPYPASDPRNPPGQHIVDPGYNYIKNAAGINIMHPMPPTTGGTTNSRRNYTNYYNTVMAVQSFNGFLLSDLYVDYTNGQALTNTQKTLISQATDAKGWVASIATEDLGIVLRQILMFGSQSYVLLMELVKAERQMVAAQAMTNTLLILNMQSTETLLYGQATGSMPSMTK